MVASEYVELHDESCPHCGDTPFRIERPYDVVMHTPDGNGREVTGDAFCRCCYRELDLKHLPMVMRDGWVIVTR